MSYYERWIASITNNLLEKGVITVDELGRRMAQIGEAWPAGAEARDAKLAESKPLARAFPSAPSGARAPPLRRGPYAPPSSCPPRQVGTRGSTGPTAHRGSAAGGEKGGK